MNALVILAVLGFALAIPQYESPLKMPTVKSGETFGSMECNQLQRRLRNASEDHHIPRNGSDRSGRNTSNRNRNQYMDGPRDTDSGPVPTEPSPRTTRAESDRQVEVRGLIEDGINKTINDNLANLTEPIEIDSLPVDFGDGDTLSGGFNVTNANIQGIKRLIAKAISLDIWTMHLDLELEISELIVTFKYWADMVLLKLVPLYGEGRINVVLEDLDVTVSGHANLTDGISLDNITIGITLGDAAFDLNGLINNPEFSALVSTALNDNFVTFVDKNADVISSIISPIVESIIDKILHPSDDDDTFQKAQLLIEEYRLY